MISNRDILLLKKKIVSARSLLMEKHPFFGLLLMHMRYIALPGMDQISTNGESIFFSPNQMKKYSRNELCSLLCHQMLHILYGDIFRPSASIGDEFHYSCDLIVNKDLKACGVDVNYVYLRAISDEDSEDDWGAFEIRTKRRMADTDAFWSYDLYNVENGVVILEAPCDLWGEYDGLTSRKPTSDDADSQKGNGCGESEDHQSQEQDDDQAQKRGDGQAQEQDNEGVGTYRGQHSQLKGIWNKLAEKYSKAGNIPMGVKRVWEETKNGRVDWRKLLVDFIQEETFDYSFCPPDKRSDDLGFFLPDFNEKDQVVQDVLFMVDTSGSISECDLNNAFSEINHAINLFNGKLRGMLGFFDADIIEPIPFSSSDDVARISPYGGGGTDFCPIFKYMAQHYSGHLPACLIIFTDGEGTYPKPNAAMGVPVLWLVNNDYVTPPFGKVVRVISNPFAYKT